MGTASVEEKLAALPDMDGVLVTRELGAAEDEGGGWEKASGDGAEALQAAPATLGSSGLEILPAGQRREISRDIVLKALFNRSLESMLAESGLSPASVTTAAEAAARHINIREIQAGYLLAFRTDKSAEAIAGRDVIHLSLYDKRGLIGSIGQTGDGGYAPISDPWEKDGLVAYALDEEENASGKRFRIMDGIYSAGVRNGIAPPILTETIMQMARSYDLGQFIQRDDVFSIIYSEAPREAARGEGHVLYASVTHAGETLSCYMLRPTQDSAFTCMTEKDTVTERLGRRVSSYRWTARCARASAFADIRFLATCGCTRASTGPLRPARRCVPHLTALWILRGKAAAMAILSASAMPAIWAQAMRISPRLPKTSEKGPQSPPAR